MTKEFYIQAAVYDTTPPTIYEEVVQADSMEEAREEFQPCYWNGYTFVNYGDYVIKIFSYGGEIQQQAQKSFYKCKMLI